MRILIISEFFPLSKRLNFMGGVEARNFYVAKELSRKNRITVITRHLKGSKKEFFLGRVKVITVGNDGQYSATVGSFSERIKFIQGAIKVGSNLEADLVEGTNFITHLIAREIAKKKNIPSIAWYPDVWIGDWIKNSGLTGILGEALERFNLERGFDRYIAISKQTAEKLKKHIPEEVRVIPCGVDLREIKPSKGKAKISQIISVGRLVPYKNQQIVIDAFSKLDMKNAQLLIVGNGPTRGVLNKLAKEKGVNSKVKFLSDVPRKKLVVLLTESSILVSGSLVEGFGISVIEGCAAGLPYVISDIAVFREITKKGKGGYLVNPKNPEEFAKKISLLLTDKKLYLAKSREALKLAQSYDWKKIARKTEEEYGRVLK